MHPKDCPRSWDYELHPQAGLIRQRIREFLLKLKGGQIDTLNVAVDTRPLHHSTFSGLTPPACDYYAGHYRGEPYRCLEHLQVTIPGDQRVGCRPKLVLGYMREFSNYVRTGLAALDAGKEARGVSDEVRLRTLVAFASTAFVSFLTIHPYANGNGHMARTIVWCLFGRYGYWPRNWPVDPRPPEPYEELIKQHRDGNWVPLEKFFLEMLQS